MSTISIKAGAEKPGKGKKISWEAFRKEYLPLEDGYKYEWLDGVVEKSPVAMDKTQLYILRNLQEYLITKALKKTPAAKATGENSVFNICKLRGKSQSRKSEFGKATG